MKNRILNNIFKVTASNMIKLISSVLIGFIIPAVFSLDHYGYYKLFTLYVAYISVFHLGFIDGVYIDIAGRDYGSLDKPLMRSHSRALLSVQIVFSLLTIASALLFFREDRQTVLIFVGISIILNNMISYFQHISQSTSRFNEYSLRNIIYSVFMSFGVILIYVGHKDDYILYLIYTVFVNSILLIWYVYTYRSIVFGKSIGIKSYIKYFKDVISIGFPMLLGYFITVMILNLSKQVVDFYYDIRTFAIYSFSFNLLSIINVFILSISVVVFPIIKDLSSDFFKKYYSSTVSFVLVLVSLSLVVIFPLGYLVESFLPKYSESMEILRIIFPSLLSTSIIQVVRLNYFKVNKDKKNYLYSGIVTLLFSFLITFGSYYMTKSTVFVALSTVISFFLWYIITEIHFIKKHSVDYLKNIIFIVMVTLIFYLTNSLESTLLGMITYLVGTISTIFILLRNELMRVLNLIKRRLA